MPNRICLALCTFLLMSPAFSPRAAAELSAGTAQVDITPPVGTPSAGYGNRNGRPMEGTHDPLLATALVLDNGETKVGFVGIDHLGMGRAMIEGVLKQVQAQPGLEKLEVFAGSSHTHSGGGAFLNIPLLGERLAGKYDEKIYQSYIDGVARAVIEAAGKMKPAQAGIGYGEAALNHYRGDWPPNVETQKQVTVIKVTSPDGAPLAVLFNYAAHPTVLSGKNMQFSADFVGFARDSLRSQLGGSVQPVFFNGAQGDVSPQPPSAEEGFGRAQAMGEALAQEVKRVWDATQVSDALQIELVRHAYQVLPEGAPSSVPIPLGKQDSELSVLVLNDKQAFVAIPGELSTLIDADLKRFGKWLGFEHVSILGLTNDAHGYIILPESWRHKTYESTLSFGGELYGDRMESMADALLHELEPAGSYNETEERESKALDMLDGK